MPKYEDPKELTDRIAREENMADRAAVDRYLVNPVMKGAKALKEAALGTPEQNHKAAESMKAQDKKNPDSFQAKLNRLVGYGDEEGKKKGGCIKMKSGGKAKSASARADGIATKGKTRGKII